MRRISVAVFLSFFLAILMITWPHLNQNKKVEISKLIDIGVENKSHSAFIEKVSQDKKFKQRNAKIRVFVGPYLQVLGFDGCLKSIHSNYYVLLDWHFYNSLDQGEKEALIAHELGHIVYVPNIVEALVLEVEHPFKNWPFFKNQREQISTKYQILADTFSARETSPEKMISLLNKLYPHDKNSLDYKKRMRSLENLRTKPVKTQTLSTDNHSPRIKFIKPGQTMTCFLFVLLIRWVK